MRKLIGLIGLSLLLGLMTGCNASGPDARLVPLVGSLYYKEPALKTRLGVFSQDNIEAGSYVNVDKDISGTMELQLCFSKLQSVSCSQVVYLKPLVVSTTPTPKSNVAATVTETAEAAPSGSPLGIGEFFAGLSDRASKVSGISENDWRGPNTPVGLGSVFGMVLVYIFVNRKRIDLIKQTKPNTTDVSVTRAKTQDGLEIPEMKYTVGWRVSTQADRKLLYESLADPAKGTSSYDEAEKMIIAAIRSAVVFAAPSFQLTKLDAGIRNVNLLLPPYFIMRDFGVDFQYCRLEGVDYSPAQESLISQLATASGVSDGFSTEVDKLQIRNGLNRPEAIALAVDLRKIDAAKEIANSGKAYGAFPLNALSGGNNVRSRSNTGRQKSRSGRNSTSQGSTGPANPTSSGTTKP